MNASAIVTAARTAIALFRLQPTSVSSTSAAGSPASFFSALTPAFPTTALWVTRVKTRLDRYTRKRITAISSEMCRAGSSTPVGRHPVDRRNDQSERREHQQRTIDPGHARIERLRLDLEPAGDHRNPQTEQQVADDRTRERRLDDPDQAPVQREQADDDLRRVAQRRVEQPARASAPGTRPAPRSRRPSTRRAARSPGPTR